MAHSPRCATFSAYSSTLFSGKSNLFCTSAVSSLMRRPFSPRTFCVLVARMMISRRAGVWRTWDERCVQARHIQTMICVYCNKGTLIYKSLRAIPVCFLQYTSLHKKMFCCLCFACKQQSLLNWPVHRCIHLLPARWLGSGSIQPWRRHPSQTAEYTENYFRRFATQNSSIEH